MYKNFKISLLLLLSGKGNRFQSDIPKQFHTLLGKKIYLHTLDAFYELDIFDEIILVTSTNWIDQVKKEIFNYKNIKVIQGGKERQTSAFLGLKAILDTDFVMFHDAVRPFVTKKIIIDNLDAVIKYRAVNTCIKSTDTLVQIDKKGKIYKIPDRSTLMRGQTPQTFEYKLILNAHEKALKNGIFAATDDCTLVLDQTLIHVVGGAETNIKITSPSDLILAEKILKSRKQSEELKNNNISSNKSLKSKIYAIVGASGGIGKEIIKLLKKENAEVIEISRTSKYKADLEDFSSIEKVFDKIYKKFGKIDGLINAAGLFLVKPFKKLSKEEIEKLIKVNLLGLIYSCKEAKIKENGHIINISSSSYKDGRKNYGIYSAAKAAVVNFTQSLSKETPNLKINVVAPGRTNTQMRKRFFPSEKDSLLLDPKDVALKIINVLKNKSSTDTIIEIKK
ncbi:MAG: putative ribitol-5-phosphate cytidylyltransferase [Candidatus Anoxychlamydiales bacterium]|nr:putative ribitol-5-phosphate cytidylyltransferase [Candidatus Anoxychlamydiales bacterium]NGX40718.1 putative ribitol-5-phosphate cytidylyltransferase [Candidatus Anoxychlamydiales bacterium]HEU64369.1 2-C-methyl-D-erythritol 4-phosphate cytidylyltransferase [Chlamydiota bacterium]